MKVQIRHRGVRFTRTQCMRLERDLDMVLARFGERIDRVIVEISEDDAEGIKCCEIEVRLKPQIFKVEHSDADVFRAVEYAALRVGRSVRRAIEIEGMTRR